MESVTVAGKLGRALEAARTKARERLAQEADFWVRGAFEGAQGEGAAAEAAAALRARSVEGKRVFCARAFTARLVAEVTAPAEVDAVVARVLEQAERASFGEAGGYEVDEEIAARVVTAAIGIAGRM